MMMVVMPEILKLLQPKFHYCLGYAWSSRMSMETTAELLVNFRLTNQPAPSATTASIGTKSPFVKL